LASLAISQSNGPGRNRQRSKKTVGVQGLSFMADAGGRR
jgi:hypothetical protein